jgi:hypothetical protein
VGLQLASIALALGRLYRAEENASLLWSLVVAAAAFNLWHQGRARLSGLGLLPSPVGGLAQHALHKLPDHVQGKRLAQAGHGGLCQELCGFRTHDVAGQKDEQW